MIVRVNNNWDPELFDSNIFNPTAIHKWMSLDSRIIINPMDGKIVEILKGL